MLQEQYAEKLFSFHFSFAAGSKVLFLTFKKSKYKFYDLLNNVYMFFLCSIEMQLSHNANKTIDLSMYDSFS